MQTRKCDANADADANANTVINAATEANAKADANVICIKINVPLPLDGERNCSVGDGDMEWTRNHYMK